MSKKLAIPSVLTPFFPRASRDRLQRWLGYRGTVLERAILLRDLVEAGILTSNRLGNFSLASSLQSSSGFTDTTLWGHQAHDAGTDIERLMTLIGMITSGNKPVMIMVSFNMYYKDCSTIKFELRRYDDTRAAAGYNVVKQWTNSYSTGEDQRVPYTLIARDEPPAGRWRYELYLTGRTDSAAGAEAHWDPDASAAEYTFSGGVSGYKNISGHSQNGAWRTAFGVQPYNFGTHGAGTFSFSVQPYYVPDIHYPLHARIGGMIGLTTTNTTPTVHITTGYGMGNGNHPDTSSAFVPDQWRCWPAGNTCPGTAGDNTEDMHGADHVGDTHWLYAHDVQDDIATISMIVDTAGNAQVTIASSNQTEECCNKSFAISTATNYYPAYSADWSTATYIPPTTGIVTTWTNWPTIGATPDPYTGIHNINAFATETEKI